MREKIKKIYEISWNYIAILSIKKNAVNTANKQTKTAKV